MLVTDACSLKVTKAFRAFAVVTRSHWRRQDLLRGGTKQGVESETPKKAPRTRRGRRGGNKE